MGRSRGPQSAVCPATAFTALSSRCFVTAAALKLRLEGFGGKAEVEIIGSNDAFQGLSFK